MHTCPLGLRCAGVPIVLGDELIGLVKLVVDPEVSKERFRSLVGLLQVLIAQPCGDLYILLLQEEVDALQRSVDRLRRVRRPGRLARSRPEPVTSTVRVNGDSPKVRALIRRVLDHLDEHYADRGLSLNEVARAVGKNEKYIAHLFVRQVGERMRTYITAHRVRRACELLLETTRTIEQTARDSGFAHAAQLRQAFRHNIGVTASEYRLIFTAET